MGNIAGILEALMVICFGISWPISIIKSIKTKSTKGKSLVFLAIIDIGYIFGIISKIISNNITYVFVFYCINFVMVLFDLILFLINKKNEKK